MTGTEKYRMEQCKNYINGNKNMQKKRINPYFIKENDATWN